MLKISWQHIRTGICPVPEMVDDCVNYKDFGRCENCVKLLSYFYIFKRREKPSNFCFFVVNEACALGTHLLLLLAISFYIRICD